MSIDLEKNKAHVLQVHNDVLDEKSSTDWALFGYEGQTNVLKVIGYGDEGLEELLEELNASKIMYGVIRIQDPKTSRMKFILLNWQGEGAPNLRKGVCARHLPDVKKMLKGVNITLTARTEEDVDYETILNAVAKATSTEYNFKERSELPDRNLPVGTNYKRTNPQTEIDANRRNKFWEEQEAEEKVRKEEEIRKREEEIKQMEKERMERELRESKQREAINKERNAKILAEKKAEMAAMTHRVETPSSWGVQRAQQKVDTNQEREDEEVERARRADIMRMERKKEAESLIGHKTLQARSIFESNTNITSSHIMESKQSLSRPPPRKLKNFNPTANNTELSYSKHKENLTPKKSVGSRWPPPTEETFPEQQNKVPGKITEWKPNEFKSQEAQIISPQNETVSNQNSVTASSINHSIHQECLPPLPHVTPSANVFHSSPPPETIEPPPSFSSSPPPLNISKNGDIGKEKQVVGDQEHSPNGFDYMPEVEIGAQTNGTSISDPSMPYKDQVEDEFSSICMTYEVDGIEYQILPEHGLCARALYDYQAADDTEITFDPGDIITNIDQIDVGWWQGVSPTGVFGLFPANYVELINGSKIH